MDQRPKQAETHSSTFPQDSDSDSESEIELRSTHTSPETTTSDESDGTLVDTSTSPTPTQSLPGEGDLDSTKGHSQLPAGTLPLDDNPPEKPLEKYPSPGPSKFEGPTSDPLKDTSDYSLRTVAKVTNPACKELVHVVDTSQSLLIEENPKAPLDPEKSLDIPSSNKSQSVPSEDPFARFWSGQTADTSGSNKKRHRWLIKTREKAFNTF